MKTKTPATRIELTAQELETIYTALNRLACHYSEQSETRKKIEAGTYTAEDYRNPDYFFEKWEFVGDIKNRIYKAQTRLDGRC